jgi:hypothetical protein
MKNLKDLLSENMRRFGTKNLSEQVDAQTIQMKLISKFVDEKKIGMEYKDPSMKDEFFNDYSAEYQDWLLKNGFKMSDIDIAAATGASQADLMRINNLITQKRW